MDLRILRRPANDQVVGYRGTDRPTPYYVAGLEEHHPANQAFLWLCDAGGESGIVHNLVKAQALVDIYRQLYPPQHFEIVEVTIGTHPPMTTRDFLGFDLSADSGHSLLSWGLTLERQPRAALPQEDIFWALRPLLRLVEQFFQPRLNAYGLFDDYETARFCLACLMALQEVRPGLWEDPTVRFDVVGVWLVRTEGI